MKPGMTWKVRAGTGGCKSRKAANWREDWALGTQISAPPWLCDPGHVSSLSGPPCTGSGSATSLQGSRQDWHRSTCGAWVRVWYTVGAHSTDLNRHYTRRRDLHCTRRGGLPGGRVAQGLPGSPVPRATGKEVQGTVSPRRRGWGAPVLGSQAWGRELSQGLGSHRGNGSRFGPGVRTGGSGEARTRVHRRESGLTSAGAAGTQRGRGRESPGRRERADD